MRITPTQEQIRYLTAVGVKTGTLPLPESVSVTHQQRRIETIPSRRRKIPWWSLILAVLLLLTVVALVRAQNVNKAAGDSVAVPAVVKPLGGAGLHQKIALPELEVTTFNDKIGRSPAWEQITSLSLRVGAVERCLAALSDTLLNKHQAEKERVNRLVRDLQVDLSRVRGLSSSRIPSRAEYGDSVSVQRPLAERIPATTSDIQTTGKELTPTEMKELQQDQRQPPAAPEGVLVWILILAAVIIVSVVIELVLLEIRVSRLERGSFFKLAETASGSGGSPSVPLPSKTSQDSSPARDIKVEPARLRPLPVLNPDQRMKAMIAVARKYRRLRVKPSQTSDPWSLGLATHKGNVRSENQDHGLCFRIDGHDVLVIADGCGGVPHGQRASHIASLSAVESVMQAYGAAPRWRSPHPKDAARKAIMDAAHRLAIEGDKMNVSSIRDGLRTTLIVVIANRREIGFSYIGDGGGYVIGASGDICRFLTPQKAGNGALNILAASLGPRMEGTPVSGTIKRSAGDLLIVGTDGVFDRVDQSFAVDVLRGCIQYKGDLQRAAEQIITELASFRDVGGYVCDDNLTMGLLGHGSAPKLPPGYWVGENGIENEADAVSSVAASARSKDQV